MFRSDKFSDIQTIVGRLKLATPIIKELCAICGAPGLSLGVYHRGETIYYGNFGYRDVEAKIAPDENTVYGISSITKGFTAAACGILVDEGQIKWDEPIKKYVPEFQTERNPIVSEKATLVDLLAHRTGLTVRNSAWLGADNHLLFEKKDTIKMCNIIDPARPFRSQWLYNNWMYALAGEIIESVTGESYSTYLWKEILKPLGLERTVTDLPCIVDDNVARPYMALDNGSAFPIPQSEFADGNILTSAVGMRSCVKDLLTWLKFLLNAASHESRTNSTSTPGSPLKQVSTLFAKHVSTTTPAVPEQSYGLGWVRTILPGALGFVGYNGVFIPKMPIVGEGSDPRLVLYHSGSTPGYTTSLYAFPETDSAIVVLTNSLGLCDCADFVGQVLIHALFDIRGGPDYTELARQAAEANVRMFTEVEKELADSRSHGTVSLPLNEYVGRYYNAVQTIYLEVCAAGTSLTFAVNGLKSQEYELRHYHFDTFSFHFSRDEQVKRARFTFGNGKSYLLQFQRNEEGRVESVNWAHDKMWPAGEVFSKDMGKSRL